MCLVSQRNYYTLIVLVCYHSIYIHFSKKHLMLLCYYLRRLSWAPRVIFDMITFTNRIDSNSSSSTRYLNYPCLRAEEFGNFRRKLISVKWFIIDPHNPHKNYILGKITFIYSRHTILFCFLFCSMIWQILFGLKDIGHGGSFTYFAPTTVVSRPMMAKLTWRHAFR